MKRAELIYLDELFFIIEHIESEMEKSSEVTEEYKRLIYMFTDKLENYVQTKLNRLTAIDLRSLEPKKGFFPKGGGESKRYNAAVKE